MTAENRLDKEGLVSPLHHVRGVAEHHGRTTAQIAICKPRKLPSFAASHFGDTQGARGFVCHESGVGTHSDTVTVRAACHVERKGAPRNGYIVPRPDAWEDNAGCHRTHSTRLHVSLHVVCSAALCGYNDLHCLHPGRFSSHYSLRCPQISSGVPGLGG